MNWLGVLVVSPLWAMVSTQLLLQSCLSVANFGIAIFAVSKGTMPLSNFAAAAIAATLGFVVFAGLLAGGFYLIETETSLGSTRAEKIVFWLFVIFSIAYMASGFISKLRKQWRNCMVRGSLEHDIAARKAAH